MAHTTHPDPTTDGQADGRTLTDLAAAIGTLAGATRTATTTPTDAGLAAAATLLAAIDRLTATIVRILQHADHHTVIAEHGLTRDTWLRAIARRTGADAGMLLAATERLADMPTVTAWFDHGTLTWGTVRAIVAATRTLTASQRRWIDDTLHDARDRLLACDQDQIAAAVDGLVHQARPDLQTTRETSQLQHRWLTLQPHLDGTASIHGTLDPETAAAALAAFAAANHRDGPGDTGDDMTPGDRVRAARRQTNVDTFRNLCLQRLTNTTSHHTDERDPAGGGPNEPSSGDAHDPSDHASTDHDDRAGRDDTGDTAHPDGTTQPGRGGCPTCGAAPSTARPSMLIIADLAALDPDAPIASGTAHLHWATTHAPVELTPAGAQRLACDATLRTIITDGATILGVTAAHPKVSATLRAALAARDGGCRFPTCTKPIDACDAHHLTPVAYGGPTTLANLALVCRDHHHAIHDSGWTTTLHPDAAMTYTRRGVTLTSQPRHHQHAQPEAPPPTGRPRRGQRHPTTPHPPRTTQPADSGDPPPHHSHHPPGTDHPATTDPAPLPF